MIAHLKGTIIALNEKNCIVETGDIGYRVFVTGETLTTCILGEQISFWITHIVREDTEELYGFATLTDQNLFELLLGVSGIGPRSALGVMNVTTIETIARAAQTNDVSYLTKISGIGKKTAEKIIIELRDKLPEIQDTDLKESSHDVIDALVALGYNETVAREAVRSLEVTLDTQTKIREALKKINNS